MSETTLRTPDQNLQLLLDRYSLVGFDHEPTAEDIQKMEASASVGPRQGHVFGELTKYGLVHVWADPDKSEFSNAQVLVIDHSFVTTYAHIYNRRKKVCDWTDTTGVTYSVPIVNREDSVRLIDFSEWTSGKYNDERDRAETNYSRVTRALAQFATVKPHYDALHQAVALRNPDVHENMAQLFPYAGELIGPRVNIEEMARAGVHFHPAVAAALKSVPDMVTE